MNIRLSALLLSLCALVATGIAAAAAAPAYRFTALDSLGAGHITGAAFLGDTFGGGQFRAYLLTPVPEPETYVMMVVGLIVLGSVARRRKG